MKQSMVSTDLWHTEMPPSGEGDGWSHVHHKDYQVHVLEKAQKVPSNRPVIYTTEQQRLAYFRGYTTSPFKTMITYTQQLDFTRFIWSYMLNVILRSLPMNYIHVFLAAYSPDEHLYASKMVPLCTGASWQVIAAGFFQLVASADFLLLFLHYAIFGIVSASPWQECKIKSHPDGTACISLNRFLNMTHKLRWTYGGDSVNTFTVFFTGNTYTFSSKSDETYRTTKFLPSPQNYFLRMYKKTNIWQMSSWEFLPYFIVIWLGAACFYKQIYRQYLWKLMVRMQLFLNFMYLSSVIYMLYTFLNLKQPLQVRVTNHKAVDAGLQFDFDMVAECVAGPPVIQLLISRSGEQVTPSRDSALITVSNTAFYLFRSFTNLLLKNFTMHIVGMPVLISWFNEYPILYQWQYFYTKVFVGQLLLRIFYVLTFMVEFLIFVITYQLLIETVACEWQWARRWISSLLFSFTGLILSVCLSNMAKVYLYILSSVISSLTESVVILWLYPLGRLIDDIYFHVGTPMGSFRRWIYRFIPLYYIYKIINLYEGAKYLVNEEIKTSVFTDTAGAKYWTYWIPVTLLAAGALYAMAKHLIGSKQNWRVLMRPRPDWGPRDHVVRQLRKQFDSRDYIGSQAVRLLSRHMLSKLRTPSYRLDVRYESALVSDARRSTVIADNINVGRDETSEIRF